MVSPADQASLGKRVSLEGVELFEQDLPLFLLEIPLGKQVSFFLACFLQAGASILVP